MNAISRLQERLEREIPAFTWRCTPALRPGPDRDADVSEAIRIQASKGGATVMGTPVFVSGTLLRRWGIDSTAHMICNELRIGDAGLSLGREWDKLSEL